MVLSLVGADTVGAGVIVGFAGVLGGDTVGAGGIVGRVCWVESTRCEVGWVWTDVTLCGVVEGAIGVEAVGRVSALPPSDVFCCGFPDPVF